MRPSQLSPTALNCPEITLPNRDQDTMTPAGGHEGGKPKNLRFIVGGLVIMFLLGMAIVGASTKVRRCRSTSSSVLQERNGQECCG